MTITDNNPERKRELRIISLAKLFLKTKDEDQLWNKARSHYFVTHSTAKNYIESAIILSKDPKFIKENKPYA